MTEDFAEVIAAPVAPVGHNSGNLAPMTDFLDRAYAELAARAKSLQVSIGTIPAVIETEAEMKLANDLAAMIADHLDKAEKARVTEKKPFLDGERAIDLFFVTINDPMREGIALLRKRGGEYLKSQSPTDEPPRVRSMTGALSTLRTSWKATITDRTRLGAKTLIHFFSDDCLQKAVNGWMKANIEKVKNGTAHLAGVKFEEQSDAVYRR